MSQAELKRCHSQSTHYFPRRVPVLPQGCGFQSDCKTRTVSQQLQHLCVAEILSISLGCVTPHIYRSECKALVFAVDQCHWDSTIGLGDWVAKVASCISVSSDNTQKQKLIETVLDTAILSILSQIFCRTHCHFLGHFRTFPETRVLSTGTCGFFCL